MPEGLDPWLCGHAPRVNRGECGDIDMDAYGIVFELLKIKNIEQIITRNGTFIDLAASDGRYVMAAALGLNFLRLVGLQSVEEECEKAKRFINRYNTRFRKDMSRFHQSQRIAIVQTTPENYDKLEESICMYVHWPILEDLFYKKKNRFYYWTDLITILSEVRKGSMFIVTDDSCYDVFEEEEDEGIIHVETRPGNSLAGWKLIRGPTKHHFSKGERTIFIYKKVEIFDSGTLELMEDLRDEEAEDAKRMRELQEDADGETLF